MYRSFTLWSWHEDPSRNRILTSELPDCLSLSLQNLCLAKHKVLLRIAIYTSPKVSLDYRRPSTAVICADTESLQLVHPLHHRLSRLLFSSLPSASSRLNLLSPSLISAACAADSFSPCIPGIHPLGSTFFKPAGTAPSCVYAAMSTRNLCS